MRYWRACSTTCHVAALAPILAQSATPVMVDQNVCGRACRQTFRTVQFVDSPKGAFFQTQECSSRLHQQGLYLCWGIHCTEEVRVTELRDMNQTCLDLTGAALPPYDIVDEFSDEDIAQLTRFNATYPDRARPFDVPMLPSQPFYDLWARTLDAIQYMHNYHYYYGWVMVIFWMLVVAVGAVNRALMHLEAWSVRSFSSQGPGLIWLKRNILIPATFGRRCVQDFGGWGTLPPRVQSLTLLLFVAINVACSVHGYRLFEGNVYYPTITMQLLRHVSDRTGVLSFANFPLIWLFGMRNNLALWLTGWNFGTYNNFHRWVARVATVQAIIHSIGYTILIFRKGGWPYFWRLWTFKFWWTGELATVFMSLLLLFSAFWVRRRQYELFLVVHIAFSILILITMLGHVSIFNQRFDSLVWIPVIIWFLDRALRWTRIMAFNPWFWNTNASISYDESTHIIRLTVPISSSVYSIKPGTFYYLMVLNKSNFWESHPFTVASVLESNHCKVESRDESSPLLEQQDIRGEPKRSEGEMMFLIRPYDSFTSRLKEYAESSQPKPAIVRMAVDGPYGRTLPLDRFNKVLFLVGGSGIAVPLSYLKWLTGCFTGPKSIDIHWAVRQPALAVDILQRELKNILNSEQVRITIYAAALCNGAMGDETACRLVNWKAKRMDIEEVIGETVNTGEQGSLAVITCGPARMADSSRKAVAAQMTSSSARIEYFEESFQW